MSATYLDQLAGYFAGRRWFAGKGREFTITSVHPLGWLSGSDPLVRVEIVAVAFADGSIDAYQFPVAYLLEPDPTMAHAFVGIVSDPEMGEVAAYDAVYFKAATDLLLDGFRNAVELSDITFRTVDAERLPEQGAAGLVMTGEQSNTSIAFGEKGILKLFRRISEGDNPDIEIHEALTRHGSEHIAPLLGWIAGSWADAAGERHHGHLGMLQVFLRTATDGWVMALSSVRDLLVEADLHPADVGGDFAAEAERLGAATAEVHADLASLFDTATLDGEGASGLAAAMHRRLDAAVEVVPDLADLATGLRRRFDALGAAQEPVAVQRIHGDLHLGQTLRTVKGWKLLDFEGEPAKTLPERIALDSPMRDVAGMLRSFDYAAGSTLREFGADYQLSYRADEWAERNRGAFLDGYATAAGADVSATSVAVRAYEADKAVYEAVYEARNRPTWLGIPLRAATRLAAEE